MSSARVPEVRLDVGGGSTLLRIEVGGVAIVASVPDGTSAQEVDEAIEDLALELDYTRRLGGR